MEPRYVEAGGSWRTCGLLVLVFAALVVLDVRAGGTVPPLLWVLAVVAVLGVAAALVVSANRVWTVTVAGRGADATLTVGHEVLPLAELDPGALQAGGAGVDLGAPVLGGGVTVPRGRVGLPVQRTDGTTVLVPTRAPAELTEALRAAHPGGLRAAHPGGSRAAHPGAAATPDAPGTLES